MIDDEAFVTFVRSRMPRLDAPEVPHDLWPVLLERTRERRAWPRTDVMLAAAVAVSVLIRPDLFFLVAFYF